MNDPDVILAIHRHADGVALNPVVRQRLGPHRVDLEPGRLDARGFDGGFFLEPRRADSECRDHCDECKTDTKITFHVGLMLSPRKLRSQPIDRYNARYNDR